MKPAVLIHQLCHDLRESLISTSLGDFTMEAIFGFAAFHKSLVTAVAVVVGNFLFFNQLATGEKKTLRKTVLAAISAAGGSIISRNW